MFLRCFRPLSHPLHMEAYIYCSHDHLSSTKPSYFSTIPLNVFSGSFKLSFFPRNWIMKVTSLLQKAMVQGMLWHAPTSYDSLCKPSCCASPGLPCDSIHDICSFTWWRLVWWLACWPCSFYAEHDYLGFTNPESNGCSLAHMSKLVLIEQLSHAPLLIITVHAFWAVTWLCHVWYQIEALLKHKGNAAI